MKINNKEVCGVEFAYDGCHKIYIIEDESDKELAISYGYKPNSDFRPIEAIQETFNDSCDLRFIHNFKLNVTYVEQFEEAEFSY